MLINLFWDSKVPGAELGFHFFIKESYLEKDYFIESDAFINMLNYDNKIIQYQVKKIVTEEIEEHRSILFFWGSIRHHLSFLKIF